MFLVEFKLSLEINIFVSDRFVKLSIVCVWKYEVEVGYVCGKGLI